MKKLLSFLLLAVAGMAIYQQVETTRSERELWSEATSD